MRALLVSLALAQAAAAQNPYPTVCHGLTVTGGANDEPRRLRFDPITKSAASARIHARTHAELPTLPDHALGIAHSP